MDRYSSVLHVNSMMEGQTLGVRKAQAHIPRVELQEGACDVAIMRKPDRRRKGSDFVEASFIYGRNVLDLSQTRLQITDSRGNEVAVADVHTSKRGHDEFFAVAGEVPRDVDLQFHLQFNLEA